MTSTQDDSSLHRVAAVASRNAPGTPSALSSVLHLVEQDLARVELLLRRPPEGHSRCATAAADLVAAGGKRLRPALCLLSHRLASADRETGHDAVVQLAAAVEFLHSASLLHDDVIDEASCRRGAPAARVRWGNAVSVIAGDLLLVRALQKVHDLGDRWLDALTDRTLHAIVEGEVAQLEVRGKLETDASRFRYVAERKTASLFVLAMVGGARLGGADGGSSPAWRSSHDGWDWHSSFATCAGQRSNLGSLPGRIWPRGASPCRSPTCWLTANRCVRR